ncbi:MAG TPA: signaling recognition particle receptor family protein, partial [Gammaproteobacteria bacterium]|nr:signaling recognition particle receptor family protein [Gammaproteobacteria bacterium]
MFGLKAKKQPDRDTGQGKLFQRLKRGLSRTHSVLFTDVEDLFQGRQTINDEMLETLEDHLLMADVGIQASTDIMDAIRSRIKKDKIDNAADLQALLQNSLHDILKPVEQPLSIPALEKKPYVILMTGVNGVGKTTSIGKIASHLKDQGHSIMLAAGDTFRAAAVEQLQSWGERNNVPVIAQKSGADAAAVIYDALQAARSRSIDVLIADTAGRLHTQDNLMEELKKIRRVINKFDADIEPECLLVLDAGTGQNALVQAR